MIHTSNRLNGIFSLKLIIRPLNFSARVDEGAQMTVKSMTGFGAATIETTDFSYTCEIKSLNSRYFDINVRLPRYLGALEHKIISVVKRHAVRGKIELNFNIAPINSTDELPRLNEAALQHYVKLSESVIKNLPYDSNNLSIYQLLRLDGVLESPKNQVIQVIYMKTDFYSVLDLPVVNSKYLGPLRVTNLRVRLKKLLVISPGTERTSKQNELPFKRR